MYFARSCDLATTRVRPRRASCAGTDYRLPVVPVSRARARVSQVPGPSSSSVPRPRTPPVLCTLAHVDERIAVAFHEREPLGTGMLRLSRLARRGPHVRVPTHRRCCCLHRRKARYRPGGLLPDRTGFAPAGRRTEFHGYRIAHSFRTSLAWSQRDSPSHEQKIATQPQTSTERLTG